MIEALQRLAHQYPAYGFGLMFNKRRQAGLQWNTKRVYRIYRLLKLNLRRKGNKRLPNRHPQPLIIPLKMNHCWSVDFMSDALTDCRRFRLFNVVDDFNRESLAVDVDLNIQAHRVVRILDRLSAERVTRLIFAVTMAQNSLRLCCRNGLNVIHGVTLDFIQQGRPMQNGFIERFNKMLRTEVLDMYLFRRSSEVSELTEN